MEEARQKGLHDSIYFWLWASSLNAEPSLHPSVILLIETSRRAKLECSDKNLIAAQKGLRNNTKGAWGNLGLMRSVHYLDHGGIWRVLTHVKVSTWNTMYSSSYANYTMIKPFLKTASRYSGRCLYFQVEASLGDTAWLHQNGHNNTHL